MTEAELQKGCEVLADLIFHGLIATDRKDEIEHYARLIQADRPRHSHHDWTRQTLTPRRRCRAKSGQRVGLSDPSYLEEEIF